MSRLSELMEREAERYPEPPPWDGVSEVPVTLEELIEKAQRILARQEILTAHPEDHSIAASLGRWHDTLHLTIEEASPEVLLAFAATPYHSVIADVQVDEVRREVARIEAWEFFRVQDEG
jgi:hypothetical protein